MMLQFFELSSRFCCRLPLSPYWSLRQSRTSTPNIGRNSNALPHFAVGSICFFVAFSLDVFFDFMPMSTWFWLSSLSRRLQRLLSRSEPNLSRRRVLMLYRVPCPPHVYRWDRCSENMQCHVLGRFISSSPLANCFVSRVPGPQNW